MHKLHPKKITQISIMVRNYTTHHKCEKYISYDGEGLLIIDGYCGWVVSGDKSINCIIKKEEE